MTYAQAFDKIKKKLAKADTKGMDTNFAVQVTLADEDAAGTLYVAYIDGEFSVEPYDYRDNNVAIDIKTADFIKMAEGKLTKETAIEKNLLKVFGDVDVLEKITGIVKSVTRKPATKKETSKKEVAKKETPKKEAVKKETVKKETAKKETAKKETVKKETVKKPAAKKEPAKKTTEKKEIEKKTETKKTETKSGSKK